MTCHLFLHDHFQQLRIEDLKKKKLTHFASGKLQVNEVCYFRAVFSAFETLGYKFLWFSCIRFEVFHQALSVTFYLHDPHVMYIFNMKRIAIDAASTQVMIDKTM